MQRLTGKRSIKSYEVAPKNQLVEQSKPSLSVGTSQIPALKAKPIIFQQIMDGKN